MSKTNKITERLEKDLLESKQLFKVVFDHSPAAITVTDNQDRIIACNPMVEKMLGMTKKDLFNKPINVLFSTEEWKRIGSLIKRHRGKLTNAMAKIICKDGTLLDVSASTSILKTAKVR